VLVGAPALAQTAGPIFLLDIDNDSQTPIPGQDWVTQLEIPSNIQLYANIDWEGLAGQSFKAEQVSLHYWIWGTGTPGYFIVNQDFQPNDTFTVSNWFEWADIETNKPHCTYFKVQADIKFVSGEGDQQTEHVLVSNPLTFHLNAPEPGTFAALGMGLTGLLGFAIRRRK
jgi:hypothetical protein